MCARDEWNNILDLMKVELCWNSRWIGWELQMWNVSSLWTQIIICIPHWSPLPRLQWEWESKIYFLSWSRPTSRMTHEFYYYKFGFCNRKSHRWTSSLSLLTFNDRILTLFSMHRASFPDFECTFRWNQKYKSMKFSTRQHTNTSSSSGIEFPQVNAQCAWLPRSMHVGLSYRFWLWYFDKNLLKKQNWETENAYDSSVSGMQMQSCVELATCIV